jgi:hypothetical protein
LLSLRAWAKDWLFLPGLVQESVLPGLALAWAVESGSAWAVESGSAWVVESVSTWVAELRWALAAESELGSAWAAESGSAWAWPVLAERD